MNNKPFEIPEAMRELSERNVEQARDAYQKFIGTAHKAQSSVEQSTDAVADGAHSIQSLMMKFTEQNMTASFAFASKLANASNIQDALQIQQKFAQDQIKKYTSQTQELGKVMTKVTEKAKPKS